jgi:RNA 2',3'-cyclic 3'-phosphodiesterase
LPRVRLFVSVPLPPPQRAHLAAALAGLRTGDVARWHLTLVFLGEQHDPAVLLPGLRRAAATADPFALRLQGGGTFPGVLWAGVGGDEPALRALQAGVEAECRAAGLDVERRRFRPHVTVARRASDPRRLHGYEGPPWQVRSIDLVRSTLGAQPRHEALETFPLGG